MNILLISNGHGEDLIAEKLAICLINKSADIKLYVLPQVGEGHIFDSLPIVKIGPQKIMPSGGFLKSFQSFTTDLRHGLLGLHKKQINNAKKHEYDYIIAIGDFFPFICAALFLKTKKLILIATAKSDLFEPHYAIERYFFKKYNTQIFARDEITALNLQSYGINAFYVGNIMIDLIEDAYKTRKNRVDILPKKKDKTELTQVIGVLPGSRKEAVSNFKIIKQVINNLPVEWHFLLAIPTHLNKNNFKCDDIKHKYNIVNFNQMLVESNFVIGLAGTANEQCAALGIPVFTFKGTGPQTTKKRFKQQNMLLRGCSCFIDHKKSDIIAKNIKKKINDKFFLEMAQKKGSLLMGNPGAAERIIELLL